MRTNCGTPADCCLWALALAANPTRACHIAACIRLMRQLAGLPGAFLAPAIDALADPDPIRPSARYVRKGRHGLMVEFKDEE